MKKNTIVLLIIIIFAAALRLWQLGTVPLSPDWDEAALGYNAYSIMQTGKDEYSDTLPIVLQSFGDYKPALYVYFALPFIALFGLDVFAVRLPSALFGILTVLATYFLVKELFGHKTNDEERKKTTPSSYSSYLPLLTTFLLAISPWHMQFSRVAFEANMALSFIVFGVLFFLKGLYKPWLLVLSIISFGASLYTYQSEKVFVPLLAITLVLIYRKQVFSLPKKVLIRSSIVVLLVCLPMLYSFVTDANYLARARGVSLLSTQDAVLKQDEDKLLKAKEQGDIMGQIIYNRRITYGKEIVSGYLAHFDLNWLFIHGDIARHHAPGMGLLYLWELPFLLIGIYLLFCMPFSRQTKLLIFLWFAIAPIPASITNGVPHAVRTLNFLPIFQIFTAIGLVGAFAWFVSKYKMQNLKPKKIVIAYSFYLLLFILVLVNVAYYLNQYFVQQDYFNSQEWQYGYKEAVSEVIKREGSHDKVVVANTGILDQSYIFFLFYLQYPPADYQKERSGEHNFEKYEFRKIDWSKEQKDGKTLYVGQKDDFSDATTPLHQVTFLNGESGILIVDR
ncbi:MAG: glycosyltransferase family 39 protein [Patescibacteria group bacterium]